LRMFSHHLNSPSLTSGGKAVADVESPSQLTAHNQLKATQLCVTSIPILKLSLQGILRGAPFSLQLYRNGGLQLYRN
jgi:hypothetical protein